MAAPPTGVDPELAGLIESVAWIRYSDETLAELRSMLGAAPPPASSAAVIRTDHVISGDPDVVVRVHRPAEVTTGVPAILGMHGGGYIFGNRSLDDQRFEHWCSQLGLVGVSVEYRLAPEHPYPAALDDCDRRAGVVVRAHRRSRRGLRTRRRRRAQRGWRPRVRAGTPRP